jgi:hypothetical protein
MTRIAVLTLALLIGCSTEPEQQSLDSIDLVEGNPCHWKDAMCIDDLEMLHCVEGEWVQQSCVEYCGSLGTEVTAGTCNTEERMDRPDLLCSCTPPEHGCHPGEARCDTHDVLGWCGDDWTWHASSCVALCNERSLLSRGCGPHQGHMTCLCSNVGLPCEGSPAVCATDSTLAHCESGLWAERDCGEFCGWDAPCEPGHSSGAACNCDAK